MQIEFQNFSHEGKIEDHTLVFEVEGSLTLSELLSQIAKTNKDFNYYPNGYEMDHCLCLDGNRILHPKDDVSLCDKIVIVPFVEGG